MLASSIPDHVGSLYVTLLGRPSDPGGKDYWVGQIARNTTETVLNVGRKTGKDAAQVAREMNESPDSLQSQAQYDRDAAEAAAWAEYMASPGYVAPDSGGY